MKSWRAILGVSAAPEHTPPIPPFPPETLGEPSLKGIAGGKSEVKQNNVGLPTPDFVAFTERAGIAEHDGGLSRADAERLAAEEQGHASASEFFEALVAHWADRLRARQVRDDSPRAFEHLAAAQRFIADGWAEKALALGWTDIELFGLCPRAPWARFDRMGAAYTLHCVRAVTAEAMHYHPSLTRYRGTVNNDGGARLPSENSDDGR